MRKQFVSLFLGILIVLNITNAQSLQKNEYDNYEGKDSEKVYISTNTSLLFAGEYLYYSVFCLNDKTKQPSKISSLAYVLLVSEDGHIFFEQKVGLTNGRGYGDFFVSTSIPSGNYKLIGCTKWMRNGDPKLFFQEDISILNPYQSNQSAILTDKSLKKEAAVSQTSESNFENDKRFILQTDKKKYSKRSKATIEVKNFRGATGYGSYALSVRRKSDLTAKLNGHNPKSFINWHGKASEGYLPKYNNINYLPEEVGERIIGRVIPKNKAVSVLNQKIAVSIPGKDFQLKAALTDRQGNFYVDIFQGYTESVVIAQLLEGNSNDFDIEIKKDPPLDLRNLSFKRFQVDSTMEKAILTRSIHNQIENAFYEIRPDTLKVVELNDPYWGGQVEQYVLDDFTRFPTLLETMVEILPFAAIKRNGPDDLSFTVRLFENNEGEKQNALVFIDGMLVTNHKQIVDFDSKQISKINVLRDKFELAGENYRGMINIETFNEDYFDWAEWDNLTKFEITLPNINKNYFAQKYSSEQIGQENKTPDYRYQLLWNPNIDFKGNRLSIEFYTSDVPGIYEIDLEGFSIYGRPVSITETILVE